MIFPGPACTAERSGKIHIAGPIAADVAGDGGRHVKGPGGLMVRALSKSPPAPEGWRVLAAGFAFLGAGDRGSI